MIQRIQTIYIFLAGISSLALCFTLESIGVTWLKCFFYIFLVVAVAGSFINVFNFKNRTSQIIGNKVLIFINVLLIILLGYWLLSLSGGINFPEKGIELIFPIISLICLSLANRFIRRDDKLVKSVDRLR